MIDKEKQIEEIAKDLKQIKYSIPDEIDDRYRVITHLDKRGAKEFAASLAEAGYCKQSEVVKEFVAGVTVELNKRRDSELYDKDSILGIINKVAAEYGVEVEK